VTTHTDEIGRGVQRDKLLVVVFGSDRAVATGDLFGIGRAGR
jgi:hypothetical protein